jgi:dipeptidyl-peptidase-4
VPDEISFPRQSALTQRFTLGRPRSFAVSSGGATVLFLRSNGGRDPVNRLWAFDTATGQERLLADPAQLLSGGEQLSPEERARRERLREQASGIVGYATDGAAAVAVFALSGRLFAVTVADGTLTELDAHGMVVDPRPDPTGTRIAWHCPDDRSLRVVEIGSGEAHTLASEDAPEVSWGAAEFVAAEEMGRMRGFWWSPDGRQLLSARVDTSPVPVWHIADPAHPDRPANAVRYPAAGTTNADVGLFLLGLDGSRREIRWDRAAFPYLVEVHWSAGGPPLLAVTSRDQRRQRLLQADPTTGTTSTVAEEADDAWVEVVPGVPAWLSDGRLVRVAPGGGNQRLLVDDEAVTPPGLQVSSVLRVDDDVVFVAGEDPVEAHLWRWSSTGLERLSSGAGVHGGTGRDGTVVVTSMSMDRHGAVTVVRRDSTARHVTSHAEDPVLVPQVRFFEAGARRVRTALLLPRDHVRGTSLPVLMDPYGGPHAQRVVSARGAFLTPQWFADQGFAVVVADGRGTPARGPAWDREVAGDLATPVLEDQVAALHAAAEQCPDLDLDRVGIRGWSFGGYLAALAVLRSPDTFHAAVAGAPVTDWALYDTFYTERYLGVDAAGPAYRRSSIIDDAPNLTRPLLLIHGLADDNVVVAHTLRLSAALLAAGRPHQVLPLSGVTHMTPQEEVAENLLLLQVDFLRRNLAVPAAPARFSPPSPP